MSRKSVEYQLDRIFVDGFWFHFSWSKSKSKDGTMYYGALCEGAGPFFIVSIRDRHIKSAFWIEFGHKCAGTICAEVTEINRKRESGQEYFVNIGSRHVILTCTTSILAFDPKSFRKYFEKNLLEMAIVHL